MRSGHPTRTSESLGIQPHGSGIQKSALRGGRAGATRGRRDHPDRERTLHGHPKYSESTAHKQNRLTVARPVDIAHIKMLDVLKAPEFAGPSSIVKLLRRMRRHVTGTSVRSNVQGNFLIAILPRAIRAYLISKTHKRGNERVEGFLSRNSRGPECFTGRPPPPSIAPSGPGYTVVSFSRWTSNGMVVSGQIRQGCEHLITKHCFRPPN